MTDLGFRFSVIVAVAAFSALVYICFRYEKKPGKASFFLAAICVIVEISALGTAAYFGMFRLLAPYSLLP